MEASGSGKLNQCSGMWTNSDGGTFHANNLGPSAAPCLEVELFVVFTIFQSIALNEITQD